MEEDSESVEITGQVQPVLQTNQQQSETISSAGSSGEPLTFASRSSRSIIPLSRQQQQQHLILVS